MGRLNRVLARLVNRAEHRRFLRAIADPQTAQASLWNETYQTLSQAPFWRGRLAARLEDNDPTDYETYRAALERDQAGQTSSLSGQPIIFWAQSAGTTKEPKRFPLTEQYRKQFQRLNPPYLYGLIDGHPGFLRAPVLYFAGMNPTEKTAGGVDVGYISNFNYRHLPKAVARNYAVPAEVLRDEATFMELAPAYALCRDLSVMFAIAPNRIAAFGDAIASQRGDLLDLLRGKRAVPAGLPPLSITKERLQHVERVLASERVDFEALWPGLSVIGCWKSSVCALQLTLLERFVRNVPIVDAMYSATEGWFTVPNADGKPGGPLHAGAIIAEFLPVGETPGRRLLKPWELEPGKRYEIFVTNLMGLVRYRLFDVVRCNGFFGRTPKLEFLEKAGAEIMVGLSRISEAQLCDAVAPHRVKGRWIFGVNATGDQLVLYHDTPIADADAVLRQIEGGLRRGNDYYDQEVQAGSIKPLAAAALPAGHRAFAGGHAQSKPRAFVNASFEP